MSAISALTSVTFRKLSPERVIELAAEAKLGGIEWGGDIHVPAGDTKTASEVKKMTLDAGLNVLSYGSYFSVGRGQDISEFEKVIQTAAVLGAKTVRIWTGARPSKEYSQKELEAEAAELNAVCLLAKKADITVGLEYHNGTLNDTAKSSLKLLAAARSNNLKTYWQPLYGFEQNMKDIAALQKNIANVHVYNWVYGKVTERKLLNQNARDWQEYIKALGEKNYILEFAKNDDEDNFKKDAGFLNGVLSEVFDIA